MEEETDELYYVDEYEDVLQFSTCFDHEINFPEKHEQVIIHLDIDCFYAQVEILKKPLLKEKPLGVQQKNIVVTCNYIAREYGVTKLMLVKDAIKKCPNLVLVSGEDLTDYREMSYKITELLQGFSPIVERLGFDENYIDVTDIVRQRLQNFDCDETVTGHVFGNPDLNCACGCHKQLFIASHIAQEVRDKVVADLGLTTCAGVAWNKLLSKIVSGLHKPNQQTILFPNGAQQLMQSLDSVRDIPGIGCSTAKKLASLSVVTVSELQACPSESLVPMFNKSFASQLKHLSFGIDTSQIVPSGKPQSHSLEDSFRKCESIEECHVRMRQMLDKLLLRILKDGRLPQTVKLTLRKFNRTTKLLVSGSKQCALPPMLMNELSLDTLPFIGKKIFVILSNLFGKMIKCTKDLLHLTVIGVCFLNFKETQKPNQPISSFFTKNAAAKSFLNKEHSVTNLGTVREKHSSILNYIDKFQCTSSDLTNISSKFITTVDCQDVEKQQISALEPTKKLSNLETKRPLSREKVDNFFESCAKKNRIDTNENVVATVETTRVFEESHVNNSTFPHNIDYSVFNALPEEIRNELIEEWTKPSEKSSLYSVKNNQVSFKHDGNLARTKNLKHKNFDPDVLKELPEEIYKEIINYHSPSINKVSKATTKCSTITSYFKKQ